MTAAASGYSPIANAPTVATHIKKVSSKTCPSHDVSRGAEQHVVAYREVHDKIRRKSHVPRHTDGLANGVKHDKRGKTHTKTYEPYLIF